MTIKTSELRFLQSVIASPADKRVTDVARRCSEEFKIGTRLGQRFVYGSSDVAKAISMLEALGHPVEASELTDRASSVIHPGISEKSGTTEPHQDSVAFRLFRQGALESVGYCVGTKDEVLAIPATTMMVVENFESFRQLDRYKWVTERMRAWDICVVVFRGDILYPVSDAHQCVNASKLPKFGFHDYDPAGLNLSLSLPGLVEHLVPPMRTFEKLVQEGKRTDLYFGQLGQYERLLDSATLANIPELWIAMKRMQKGYPQEWMRELK